MLRNGIIYTQFEERKKMSVLIGLAFFFFLHKNHFSVKNCTIFFYPFSIYHVNGCHVECEVRVWFNFFTLNFCPKIDFISCCDANKVHVWWFESIWSQGKTFQEEKKSFMASKANHLTCILWENLTSTDFSVNRLILTG